jgi:DnaK suppressor protein
LPEILASIGWSAASGSAESELWSVAKGAAGMARREAFAEVRKRLEEERDNLLAEIDSLAIDNQNQDDDYGVGNHLADDATEVFTRERNLALRNNTQDLLDQVDSALKRLDEGTYGTCARCGNTINAERLEALPYATFCITCQSEIERSR